MRSVGEEDRRSHVCVREDYGPSLTDEDDDEDVVVCRCMQSLRDGEVVARISSSPPPHAS